MMGGAILVAYDNDEAVAEAKALCEAAGYAVEHVFCQKFMRRPKYGISEEALGALEEHAQRLGPDVIVYDEALKPSQNYNLASKLHRNVLDREALILEIFEGRASSAESKLQVKLAQMRYEMSRAREKVRLAKMGEQPGFMGIGKFEVDTYYNDIRHRMNSVKSKLVKARKQRQLHRDGRKRAGWATVSLVGYTSAGKTTLFNAVTGETKEQSGQLFTTLSTTTRRTDAGGAQVLVSDTVGFISKLPAYMIEAFRSTLEEILYADAVILVVDASDPQDRIRKKFRSCTNTLADLGVQLDRVVIALNKSDRVPRTDVLQIAQGLGLEEGARWAAVSATTGSNCKRLMEMAGKITQAGSAGQSAWRGEQ